MIRRCLNTSFLAVAGCLCILPARAQTTTPAVPDQSTIRVYVNRMQIPVLLLDSYRHPTKPVPAARFQVNLEGVPPFAPSNVRLQGDDPISLAVLLDNSDPEEFLWEKLGKASSELARSLRPQDTVEVYGMDGCKLRRFGPAEPSKSERLPADWKLPPRSSRMLSCASNWGRVPSQCPCGLRCCTWAAC